MHVYEATRAVHFQGSAIKPANAAANLSVQLSFAGVWSPVCSFRSTLCLSSLAVGEQKTGADTIYGMGLEN